MMEFKQEQLDELQPYFLEHLQTLLSFPSMYDPKTKSDSAPFGASIEDALKYMLQLGESEGFASKNLDGYAGHIEWGDGEDLIGVLGHLDVVPPGEGWSNDPFQPVLKDGKLYARGAQDDKGPVMAAFLAMKWLKDQGVQPKKRVRLILGADEERGWKCMDHYFNQEEMPSIGFSPDATFPVIHAEKGLVDLAVTTSVKNVPGAYLNLVYIQGGEALNMVPFKAVAKVEGELDEEIDSLFDQFLLHSEYKGSIEEVESGFYLTVIGESAHAMEPKDGRNAIVGLAQFLETLPFANEVHQFLSWVANSFEDGRGEAFSIECSDDVSGPLTMNLGTLTYDGTTSTLGVNVRYPVQVPYDQWFQVFVQNMKERQLEVNVQEHLEPIYLPRDHVFVQQLLSIYEKHVGEKSEPIAIGGATYARALDQGVAYGAMFSHSPDTAHKADEHILVGDLMKAALIYAEALYELIMSDE